MAGVEEMARTVPRAMGDSEGQRGFTDGIHCHVNFRHTTEQGSRTQPGFAPFTVSVTRPKGQETRRSITPLHGTSRCYCAQWSYYKNRLKSGRASQGWSDCASLRLFSSPSSSSAGLTVPKPAAGKRVEGSLPGTRAGESLQLICGLQNRARGRAG